MKPSERIAEIFAHSDMSKVDAVMRYLDEVAGNVYRDTEERMRNDPEFRASVMMLMDHAQRFGFTPGELKQIAFRAAYELEIRRSTWAVPIAEGAVK